MQILANNMQNMDSILDRANEYKNYIYTSLMIIVKNVG